MNNAKHYFKSAWTVLVPGRNPFTMTGEACTREEALQAARVIWPDAELAE